MESSRQIIKVGSRKSTLAVLQLNEAIHLLEAKYPQFTFERITMVTTGDKILENGLMDQSIDIVVHSLKDLPSTLPENLVIGALLKREDPRDILVLKKNSPYTSLEDLPVGANIGTSSVRRTAQLKDKYPQFNYLSVRGNLETRLFKLDETNSYDGLIFAAAGFLRMGWKDRISQYLDSIPAVGQGALALECRSQDAFILQLLSPLTHRDTLLTCIAERAFMRALGGGCSAPIASLCTLSQHSLKLTTGVWSLNGRKYLKRKMEVNIQEEKRPQRRKNESRPQQQQQQQPFSLQHPMFSIIVFSSIFVSLSLTLFRGDDDNDEKLQQYEDHESIESEAEAAETLGIQCAEFLANLGALELLQRAKESIEQEIGRDILSSIN